MSDDVEPRSYAARQIGTLALSHVQSPNPMAPVRAAAWANALRRLGVHLPFVVVHDLGIILTSPRQGGYRLEPRVELSTGALRLTPDQLAIVAQYQEMITTLAGSEPAVRASGWRLRDELVSVILAKLLSELFARWDEPAKGAGNTDLPLAPQSYAGADVAARYAAFDRRLLLSFLKYLVERRLYLLTALEQIDLDTVKLLGLFGGGGAMDLVDLYSVLQSPEANDVVNFSLDLLPSVLETRRAGGAQSFSVDGYASIERVGNPDSLMLTEFAYDDDLFERKIVDNELYYYGHDRPREPEGRLQYIAVDASASMRGTRQVFARGVALALAKKLALGGDEVWQRFFDSRLYDVQRVKDGDFAAPHLLSFKSERGRNYTRVFSQLASELERLAASDGRHVILYIITHGQCHIPVEIVERLRRVAFVYGIFVLPSATLSLDYMPLLNRHQIVDAAALSSRQGRRERGVAILNDAAELQRK